MRDGAAKKEERRYTKKAIAKAARVAARIRRTE
jgi:hypothetical protein